MSGRSQISRFAAAIGVALLWWGAFLASGPLLQAIPMASAYWIFVTLSCCAGTAALHFRKEGGAQPLYLALLFDAMLVFFVVAGIYQTLLTSVP